MNRLLFLLLIALAVAGCKMQTAVAPLIVRDSISITYKQGTEQPLSIHKIEEQPTPTGVRGAAIESRKNSCVPAPTTIRVDTVFVERWHTEVCQPKAVCQQSGLSGEDGLSAKRSKFYKNCTWGFFILILLLLVRIAFRLARLFYLHR